MLLTKLHIPSPSNNLVQRTDLFEKLNKGLERKLILVSAPAGFGKTTLICDWIAKNNIPAAWYSLDKGDNDPVDFLSYIISGIQNISSEFGFNILKILKSSSKPSLESITSLLINDVISIHQDFILVLDDFHNIISNEVMILVAHMIEHIPHNIHIVISTRSDPLLPIARLRSQHKMVELRSADLSFSKNDIYTLFNKKLKIKMSKEDVYSLETKTEGWIAGLQLTALSLHGCEDISGFIQGLEGDNRYIMDYLIEEVLKIQTDDIKEFLLQTSILEQISAPLCDRILNRNDSQIILEKLERNNMFIVSLDTGRNWYRYHHLFADLLKQRLLLKDKSIPKELHHKASNWFEENEMYDFAIEHLLEVKNFGKSIEIIDMIVDDLWEKGHHAALMRYGDLVPDELIIRNPSFCLYYAWILITAIQIKRAEPYLENAEKITRRIINDKASTIEEIQYHKKLLGKISVAFAYLNSQDQQSEKIFDYCKIAMKNLSEDDPLWFSWAWFAYGVAHFSVGNIQESNKAYNNALKYGNKSTNIFLISTIVIKMAENDQQLGHFKSAYKRCSDLLELMKVSKYLHITKAEWTYAGLYSILALTEYMGLEVDKALENIKIAYKLSKDVKDIPIKINILMVYSAVLLENEDRNAAKEIINELEVIIHQNEVSPFLVYAYVTWKAYLLIDMNQLDQATELFEEYGFSYDKKKTHINDLAYITYARLLLLQNKLDEVEVVLSDLFALVSPGKRTERLIELKILYAILDEMMGYHEKAIAGIVEAMEYSSGENLLIYFVFNNDYLKVLLKEVLKIHAPDNSMISKNFIDKLSFALEKRDKYKNIHFDADISSREMDTLRLIAKGLTNKEIADQLFISLHTVKSHVKNILLKLDVDKRSKAVIKAKELRIL